MKDRSTPSEAERRRGCGQRQLRDRGASVTSRARPVSASQSTAFPTWFFDYDNDGWLDLFAAGFDGTRRSIKWPATIWAGRTAADIPGCIVIAATGRSTTSRSRVRLDRVLLVMGAGYGDVDGDGYLDLYLGTGAPDLRTLMPNRMFRSRDGTRSSRT